MIRRPPISALFPCATLFRSEACRRLGLWFVSDEIYHRLTYGEAAATALAVDEDAVAINSFSKYYCMTGWRISWIVVPERDRKSPRPNFSHATISYAVFFLTS